MKQCLLLCVCLLSRAALAQTESAGAFNGANKLVLATADSASRALREFAYCLQPYGVRVLPEDRREALRFRTLPWGLTGRSKHYVVYTVIATPGPNAQLTITGEMGQLEQDAHLTIQNVARVVLTGGEKSASAQAFRIMEGAANQYIALAAIDKKKARLSYVQQLQP